MEGSRRMQEEGQCTPKYEAFIGKWRRCSACREGALATAEPHQQLKRRQQQQQQQQIVYLFVVMIVSLLWDNIHSIVALFLLLDKLASGAVGWQRSLWIPFQWFNKLLSGMNWGKLIIQSYTEWLFRNDGSSEYICMRTKDILTFLHIQLLFLILIRCISDSLHTNHSQIMNQFISLPFFFRRIHSNITN